MKIISFNINGLRARFHELQAIIDKHSPDIIGLQEIKVHDDQFPLETVQAMGYHVYHHGQKGHYGVALLSKKEPIRIQKGFDTDVEDAQRRMIMGTFLDGDKEITIMNGYFPQGESIHHETKYPAKRKFFADLMTHLHTNCTPDQNLIIMGDINIASLDLDIGIGEKNAKRWLRTGKCSFQPEERQFFKDIIDWGFQDTFRLQHPDDDDKFSWFDYRSKGYLENRGLRIDVILATESLAQSLKNTGIDFDMRAIEKPSDHAPIWAEFD